MLRQTRPSSPGPWDGPGSQIPWTADPWARPEDRPSTLPWRLSPHRCDRFISLATRWDMATAATRRGSVTPMMLSPLWEGEHRASAG